MKDNVQQGKVTIVTPSWNSEKYIIETIKSVQAQTYKNWEMIIVDDCSTDKTVEIVQKISEEDPRVRVLVQPENEGAAKARTRAMQAGTGRYVAYLDADDIWKPEKLEKQIQFMEEKKCGFSCTSYEVIDDRGNPKNKYVHMLPKVDYVGFLTNNLLQTVGIMVDTNIVSKKYLVMPNIRRRQDAATWLQILKAGFMCYGLDEILAEYRRTEGSLSSNKLKAVKGIWNLYREIEHLSIPFSCYCFARYAILAVWKRVYIK
uniref:glycosyltransferase family 2 protein n=1 Tax=Enterocloster clostridioformis TaxID=1531 RepID=UPI0026EEBEBA|nr:glycosyltransferase family 2 protein [Enterocloster clostridioformis]